MKLIIPNTKPNLIIIFIVALFIIPDDIYKLTSFCIAESPNTIDYKWIDGYSYSYLFIPIIFFGILFSAFSNNIFLKNLWRFYIAIITYNIIRIFLGDNRIIIYSSYEYFFSILTAISLFSIINYYYRSVESQKRFFSFFIILHILGLLFSISTSMGSFSGRYHSQNLDVESTAYILGIFILYYWTIIKGRKLHILILLLTLLVFTGSRIALFFILPILFILIIKDTFASIKSGFESISRKKILFIMFGVIPFTILFFINIDLIISRVDITRFTSTNLELTNISNNNLDNSFYGRIISIIVGFEVLKNNILGLPFAFIPLQIECVKYGYPTFPHSTILIFFIIVGPIFWIIFYRFLQFIYKLWTTKSDYYFIIIYILLINLFSGGALLNPKMYFVYFLALNIIISESKLKVDEKNNMHNSKLQNI